MSKTLQKKMQGELDPLTEAEKYFATHDMACAAALIMRGFEMSSLDKGDPRKVKFVFKGSKGISDALKDFWDGRLLVDAQGYFNVIKRLKNMIYSE